MATFKIEGLRELQRNLDYYAEEIQRRLVVRALSWALGPAHRAIQAATYTTVTRRTGLLREGLGIRLVRRRKVGNVPAAGVFATRAAKGFLAVARKEGRLQRRRRKRGGFSLVKEPFYWKFIEFGAERMQARPYVARAFESSTPAVLNVFRHKLAEEIDKASAGRPHK